LTTRRQCPSANSLQGMGVVGFVEFWRPGSRTQTPCHFFAIELQLCRYLLRNTSKDVSRSFYSLTAPDTPNLDWTYDITFYRKMSFIYKFLRRLATPGGIPQSVAAIGSIIVMVAIFIADVLNDDTIQMHLLYAFPLIVVCFHCKQRWLVRTVVITSILLQGIPLVLYGSVLPILSKLILATLILSTNILIAYIATSAIQYAADLSSSQAKLHGILDYSPICIWFSGTDGRYQYVNKAFCNAFGMKEEQFISRRPSEIFAGESSLDLSKTQQFCLINEISLHTRETLTFADGKSHLFEITRVMLVDEMGENSGTIGIMNDITEASALQKALKKSHDDLETRVSERTQDLQATANKLELEMQARKKLERRFLEVNEETQAQIGRELHDDLGQLLTGVAYLAGSLASRLAKLDQEAYKQAETIKNKDYYRWNVPNCRQFIPSCTETRNFFPPNSECVRTSERCSRSNFRVD